MASLYELTGEFLELQELLEDPEADVETVQAALDALGGNLRGKIDGYVKVIKNFEASTNAIDAENKRLQERKKRYEKAIDNMKQQLHATMDAMGEKKVKTDLFTVSIGSTGGKAVIDDEDEIPEKFFVQQPAKLDGKALLAYLRTDEGANCEWAHIEKGKTLRIS